MNEQELFDTWKEPSAQEKQVYKQHKNELQNIIRTKSNDVFAKIKRNIYAEGALSLLTAVGFPFLFWSEPLFFWLMLVMMVFAAGFTLKAYQGYLHGLKHLNEVNLSASLQKKIWILSRYIKQLKAYGYFFAILGFVFGMVFVLKGEPFEWLHFLVISAFTLPFLVVMLWMLKKYIQMAYGKHLNHIQQLYANLMEDEQ